MRHPVYRALNKPINLLGIDYRYIPVAFFASMLTWGAFQVLQLSALSCVVAAVAVWGSIHYGCWKYLNGEPQLIWLLIDKWTLPDNLDPLERSATTGIRIIHEK